MPDVPNLFEPHFDEEGTEPGFTFNRAMLGRQAGSEKLGASLFEIPPGEATFPYHLHSANEELLFVIDGAPSLRTPDGWRQLERGDVVAFRVGEEGAHQVMNRAEAPARVLVVSTMVAPEINLQPDSGKVVIATRAPGSRDVEGAFIESHRRSDAVPYLEDEEPPPRED